MSETIPNQSDNAKGENIKPSRRNIFDFIRQQPLGSVGIVLIFVLMLGAIFAQQIAPFNPEDVDFEASPAFGGGAPSLAHPLGADAFGRDILSRLIYGARTALSIGFLSAFFGCSIGAIIGTSSAFFGGRVDLLVQRFIDLMLSFPIIVLAIIVIAIFPKTVIFGVDVNVIVAIAIPFIPKTARVIRSQALAVVTLPYVDAARTNGFSSVRIIFRHILPNVTAPFLILITAFIGQAILLEASLSYLGLGVVEPTPSWGLMLSGVNTDYYRTAPWMIIYPGLAVSIAVFSFNLFGDSLRDWLDPKLKL